MAKAKKAAAKKGSEVAKRGTTAVAEPVDYSEYEQSVGDGFDGIDSSDLLVPFLVILQGLSPQITEKLPGFETGQIINSVTEEIWDENRILHFVPASVQHMYMEWKPDRGGFVAQHEISSDVVQWCKANQQFGKYATEAGNDLVETYHIYGVIVDKETKETTPALISFKSTAIKSAKAWFTKARSIQIRTPNGRRAAPLFSHRYILASKPAQNKKGKYFAWDIKLDNPGALMDPAGEWGQVVLEASLVAQMVKDDAIRGDFNATAGGGGSDAPSDGEIPDL